MMNMVNKSYAEWTSTVQVHQKVLINSMKWKEPDEQQLQQRRSRCCVVAAEQRRQSEKNLPVLLPARSLAQQQGPRRTM